MINFFLLTLKRPNICRVKTSLIFKLWKSATTQCFSVILFLLFASPALGINTSVNDIRLWPSPGNIRVVLDLNQPVKYKVYSLNKPYRIVLDLENTKFNVNIKNLKLQTTCISKIRIGNPINNITRLVFETTENLKPKGFLLNPHEKYGYRLVIDLESTEKQAILALFDLDQIEQHKPTTNIPIPQLPNTRRDFIIAIDAGHGGEDPGAIGNFGTKEKDINLKISHELKALINQHQGFRSFLIRDGDYYVDLRARMRRARAQNADLFISVHADAFTNSRAHGSSVFVLSKRGASSEAAKWLAEKENRADLVGGVSLDNKGDTLASVLLDLSQAANEDASLEAANYILKSIGKNASLHKRYVERAGFAVLKAPDVPSILIETGFISNPSTERLLLSDTYRKQIARNIMFGIQQYFANKPRRIIAEPINKYHLANKNVYYIVKQGDTLSKIAAKYKVSMLKLRVTNNLKKDSILINQKLVIPNR